MKYCPYCNSILNDNAVQCNICGYTYPNQYYQQQNYQQMYPPYSQTIQQNNPQTYSQQNTQRQTSPQYCQPYAQQRQQNQLYQSIPYQQTDYYNTYYPVTQPYKSSNKADQAKKKRPLWVTIISILAVIIGVCWMLHDASTGAETADEWLNESSEEAQMAEIEAEILDILDSTKVNSAFTPTIGQMIVIVFHDFSISIEPSETEESVFFVEISGDYSPSPSYPYMSMSGSITYRVDISRRVCTVWSDPNSIDATFVAYIVS